VSPRSFVNTLRGFHRETVTCVAVAEGAGQDGDPVRVVEYWYRDDGVLLVRRDPMEGLA
jgi:hypothetical protein